jgi:hypothetical protein
VKSASSTGQAPLKGARLRTALLDYADDLIPRFGIGPVRLNDAYLALLDDDDT